MFFITGPAIGFAVTTSKSPNNEDGDGNEKFSDRVQELVNFFQETGKDFTYQQKNRPDPFTPFIPQKTAVKKKKKIDEKELKGLQKYEPGQLTVVAIVMSNKRGARAMVQNAGGKGFIIKPGTEIGRYGIVDSISSNTVTVKEKYEMTTGQSQTKIVKMLLKKEGEK
ncbi:MAG: pilus assembly protein PilP [Thermodesulfobacteriota bacterium]